MWLKFNMFCTATQPKWTLGWDPKTDFGEPESIERKTGSKKELKKNVRCFFLYIYNCAFVHLNVKKQNNMINI